MSILTLALAGSVYDFVYLLNNGVYLKKTILRMKKDMHVNLTLSNIFIALSICVDNIYNDKTDYSIKFNITCKYLAEIYKDIEDGDLFTNIDAFREFNKIFMPLRYKDKDVLILLKKGINILLKLLCNEERLLFPVYRFIRESLNDIVDYDIMEKCHIRFNQH